MIYNRLYIYLFNNKDNILKCTIPIGITIVVTYIGLRILMYAVEAT